MHVQAFNLCRRTTMGTSGIQLKSLILCANCMSVFSVSIFTLGWAGLGRLEALTAADILAVAPYNMQDNLLRWYLPDEADRHG